MAFFSQPKSKPSTKVTRPRKTTRRGFFTCFARAFLGLGATSFSGGSRHCLARQNKIKTAEIPTATAKDDVFFRACCVGELCAAPSGLQSAFSSVVVKSPLFDRDVIVAAASPPTDAEGVLIAIAECLNAHWNDGRPLVKGGENTIRLPASSLQWEAVLWSKLLRSAQVPLDTLARYSRKPVAYWTDQASQTTADRYLAGENRKFLAKPNWHAHLRLWESLSPHQRQSIVLGEGEITSLTSAQLQLIEEIYTQPGPYYHDSQERNITEAQAKELTKQTVTAVASAGFSIRFVQNAITLAVSVFPPFVLPSSNEPPFPVRGNPHLPPSNPPAPVSYDDLEGLPFPSSFRANDSRHFTWASAVAELVPRLPKGFVIVSDDFAPADALLRRSKVVRRRVQDSEPVSNFQTATADEKLGLSDAVDHLCREFGRCWWRKGNVLHFRHQHWYSAQRFTPPPALMAQLKASPFAVVERGVSEETLFPLTSLLCRFDRNSLRGAVEVLDSLRYPLGAPSFRGPEAFVGIGSGLDLLPFFNGLPLEQKREAFLGDGLPLENLSSAQRQSLPYYTRMALFDTKSPPFKLIVRVSPLQPQTTSPTAAPGSSVMRTRGASREVVVAHHFSITVQYARSGWVTGINLIIPPLSKSR